VTFIDGQNFALRLRVRRKWMDARQDKRMRKAS